MSIGAAAFQVGSVVDCIGGSRRRVRVGAMSFGFGGVKITDGVAVGNNKPVKSPFVAQNLYKKLVAAAARLAFITVVGAHDLLDIGRTHEFLKSVKIGLGQIP